MPLALRLRAEVATHCIRIGTKTVTCLSLTTISWTGFSEKIARGGGATTSKGLQEMFQYRGFLTRLILFCQIGRCWPVFHRTRPRDARQRCASRKEAGA